jgi:hypothetical protein
MLLMALAMYAVHYGVQWQFSYLHRMDLNEQCLELETRRAELAAQGLADLAVEHALYESNLRLMRLGRGDEAFGDLGFTHTSGVVPLDQVGQYRATGSVAAPSSNAETTASAGWGQSTRNAPAGGTVSE